MITHASFENFKSLRDVEIDFERLTVIVGPNASGKTSVLQGLKLLSSFAKPSNEPGLASIESLQNRAADEFKISLMASDASNTLRIVLRPMPVTVASPRDSPTNTVNGPASPMTWRPEVRYTPTAGGSITDATFDMNMTGAWHNQAEIAPVFGSIKLCRFNPRILAQSSYGPNSNNVQGDGQGLASRLALIALKDPERFEIIQAHLRSLIPSVKRIRFDRVPVTKQEIEVLTVENVKIPRQIERNYQEDLILFDMNGGKGIPANLASEGTLLALGLITELLDSPQPRVLLIDDIEQGLHPKSQRQLVALLKKILEENSDLQIIATTHSPYIVDEVEAKAVRVTWADELGVTQCGRLDSHPDFERWKDELWPGEFWSIMGEESIVKRQTAKVEG
jgi:predicted ATPase